MSDFLHGLKETVLHLFFPQLCVGCGQELPSGNTGLCSLCMLDLGETGFEKQPGNPVEKKFWGRLPLVSASAIYYFQRETLIQDLMHRFKYGGDQELCVQLGKLAGRKLRQSERFHAEALVSLPLFAERERLRGYNQAELLCDGLAAVLELPVLRRAVVRNSPTESQTRKSRTDRWLNMEGRFELVRPGDLAGKHLLLVDDVVTTGATLEACGLELLKAASVSLSIVTLCYAAKV